MPKPKGIRALFWTVWGWRFNLKLKRKFKELERRGHFGPKTVSNVTTKLLNEEAQRLFDGGAIKGDQVFWNNTWIKCEVRK